MYCDDLGDFRKAIEFFQQGLTIAKEVGDKESEGRAYWKLGIAYSSLYDFPKTIEFYQKNVSNAKEIGNKKSEAMGYLKSSRPRTSHTAVSASRIVATPYFSALLPGACHFLTFCCTTA